MNETLDRIRLKLHLLCSTDPGLDIVGAGHHGYRLNMPLSKKDVSDVERRLGVYLPKD